MFCFSSNVVYDAIFNHFIKMTKELSNILLHDENTLHQNQMLCSLKKKSDSLCFKRNFKNGFLAVICCSVKSMENGINFVCVYSRTPANIMCFRIKMSPLL